MGLKEKMNGKGSLITFAVSVVVVSTSIIGAAVAVIQSNVKVEKRVAVIDTNLRNLTREVRSGMDDRFRGQDWRMNESWIRDRFDAVDAQLGDLNDEMREHRRAHSGDRQ